MKKEKILQEIEETKKHLEELERLAKEEERKGTWRPEQNEKYYYIDSSVGIEYHCNRNDNIDEWLYDIGNYFRTTEEAEFEVERLKVIQELKQFAYDFSDKDWKNGTSDKYIMMYDVESDKIITDHWYTLKHFGLHFESSEDIKDAIKSVGEDRIKKYYFRIGKGE